MAPGGAEVDTPDDTYSLSDGQTFSGHYQVVSSVIIYKRKRLSMDLTFASVLHQQA
jgi:hypothetical protein